MIEDIFTELQQRHFSSVDERIEFLSNYFLGRPYVLGAQGEGELGEFDRAPLYRLDGFDCVTFVNDVLALSLSDNADEFLDTLLSLNYYNASPTFENRFHFMSCDWNRQNQKNGFVKDITRKIGGELVKCAIGEIDKPNWYRFQKKPVPKNACIEMARIDYLPLESLLASPELFKQFPNVSIVEIVRPNWNLREKIGTQLHVSHLGFAIRCANELRFRHASSEYKKVVDVSLIDYLKNCVDSPTIKGINIQEITSLFFM